MTDVDDTARPDGDPIDAQFEPAPPSADHVATPEKPTKQGPNWRSLFATGLIATTLGAGIGAGLGRSSSDGASGIDASQYGAQIAALEADQQKFGSRLTALGADLEQAETRLADVLSEAETTLGHSEQLDDVGEALSILKSRMDILSNQSGGTSDGANELAARLLAFEQTAARLEARQNTRADALAGLTSRLATLEASSEEEGIDQTELVSLYEDVSELKGQLSEAVSDSAEREKLASLIEQFETREAVAQSASEDTRSSGKAALALLSLEAASNRGVPFREIIDALEAVEADAGLMVELRAIAPTGAPTLARLQDMLYGGLLATRAPIGEQEDGEATQDDDGWGWVRRTFGDSVKITRSDDPQSETSDNQTLEGTVNEAGLFLAKGNIAAAITRINTLSDAERNAFADWQDAADRRIRLDNALIALRASMLEQGR